MHVLSNSSHSLLTQRTWQILWIENKRSFLISYVKMLYGIMKNQTQGIVSVNFS